MLQSIENAVRRTKTTTKRDLRSDGPHPHSSKIGQTAQKYDARPDSPHPSKIGKMAQEDFPRLITTSSNRNIHCRENSGDSDQSDDGYPTNGP